MCVCVDSARCLVTGTTIFLLYKRIQERLQRELEEREQEELRAHLGARNIKVSDTVYEAFTEILNGLALSGF